MSKTYDVRHYKEIEKIERNHFWFRARNNLIQKLIQKYIPNPDGVSFLEVGFGTGVVLRLLDRMGFKTTGLDVNQKALDFAQKHTQATLIRQSIYSFKTKNRFAGIGAFDVLEHQSRDIDLLKIVAKLLLPKGLLFITVPSQQWLWSDIDVQSGHKRRYSIIELRKKLERAGFIILFWNHWQVFTLPFFLLWRQIAAANKENTIKGYLQQPSLIVNKILLALLLFEQIFFWKIKFPAGGSLIVCAQKNK